MSITVNGTFLWPEEPKRGKKVPQFLRESPFVRTLSTNDSELGKRHVIGFLMFFQIKSYSRVPCGSYSMRLLHAHRLILTAKCAKKKVIDFHKETNKPFQVNCDTCGCICIRTQTIACYECQGTGIIF